MLIVLHALVCQLLKRSTFFVFSFLILPAVFAGANEQFKFQLNLKHFRIFQKHLSAFAGKIAFDAGLKKKQIKFVKFYLAVFVYVFLSLGVQGSCFRSKKIF